MSTSMLMNAAKANSTIEELGWKLHKAGRLEDWDGLAGWFLRWAEADRSILTTSWLMESYRVLSTRLSFTR